MRRSNKIGLKLGLVILSVFVIVLSALGLAVDRMFTNFYNTEMRTEVEELTTHFATMIESPDLSMEQKLLAFADFSNVNIFNIDELGNILIHSGDFKSKDRSFIHKSDVEALFSGTMVNFEYYDTDRNRYFVAGKPILQESDNSITSAIYVMASTSHMDESISAIRKLLVLSGMGAFLLALGITWIIAQILSRPLLQMKEATRRIAVGELETRLNITTKDEVSDLADAINNLAEDLQRYRDNRQEFFANISHELRTPITYLEGYSKVIKDRLYETEEEKNQYLDIIHIEAQRLQHMVNDLFELSKMEEGTISLSMEWIDLAEITDNSVRKIKLKANDKGLQLKTHLGDHIPLIYGDGLRLEQVLLNLLENAVRYTETGEINVYLSQDPSFVYLTVVDTGIGILESELPNIFERFYRVEKSRSRQYGGTGLGLSIAKKFIELLEGELHVSSVIGVGTKFEIRFKHKEKQEDTR
ncbi:sensor histidine kinase [Paenibacillus glacialis]|uniref:Circadian input-output histidine kinase CikA n=1 Tax=Paenibacillus glacialis TaxID=494026 RepID=A0A168P1L8_9BACL|nr:HAMP domain-containing sensor histidine kinase [Paenibacillus glacialis]OAB46299.1 two-component sensor histidine kinase [Paenibacillus glacialis]